MSDFRPLWGGVGRLMANAILNFHFDFLNPSLILKPTLLWSSNSVGEQVILPQSWIHQVLQEVPPQPSLVLDMSQPSVSMWTSRAKYREEMVQL